jgi:hypothetical protein
MDGETPVCCGHPDWNRARRGRRAPMIEFIQNYGLWIALAGVFVAMHWFGRGCCGGRQRQGQGQRTEGRSDEGPRDDKAREVTPKSKGSCH